MQSDFKFLYDWTTSYFPKWKKITATYNPKKVLEIGSFEGRSSLFWSACNTVESVTCIDTWEGSFEHTGIDFNIIEDNFDFNTSSSTKIIKKKGTSLSRLSELIHEKCKFDLIYIDGSHEAHDVISDAVMAYALLNNNGIMIFDDYLWINRYKYGPWTGPRPDKIISHPKLAIDAFVNIYEPYIKIIDIGYQLILEKTIE